eukprot:NODE_560_length_6681_cov_0.715740.p1 type:complete len:816 gc:universal NODE_560_length_6681_cov_0.715740:2691-244(-)
MIGLICPSPTISLDIIDTLINTRVTYSTSIKNPQGAVITVDQHLPLYLLSNAPISIYDCLSHPIAILSIFTDKSELPDINFQISNFFLDKPFMDINCLEYTILYNNSNQNVNYILDDPLQIPLLLNHFYSQLFPFIEAMLHNLHEQVGAIRRGIAGRFFSTTRKIWKSNDPKSNYTYLDAELQTRRLADLSYFINDLTYCSALYDTLERDFLTDNKFEYASHCQAMSTLIYLNSHPIINISMFSLIKYHQQPFNWLRSVISELLKLSLKTFKIANLHHFIQIILNSKCTAYHKSILLSQLLPMTSTRLQCYISVLLLHLEVTDYSIISPLLDTIQSPFLLKHMSSLLPIINDSVLLYKMGIKLFPFVKTSDDYNQLLNELNKQNSAVDGFSHIKTTVPLIYAPLTFRSVECSKFVNRISKTVLADQKSVIEITLKNTYSFDLAMQDIQLLLNTPLNTNIIIRPTITNTTIPAYSNSLLLFNHTFSPGTFTIDQLQYTNKLLFTLIFNDLSIIANTLPILKITYDIPEVVYFNEFITFEIKINSEIPCSCEIELNILPTREIKLKQGDNVIAYQYLIERRGQLNIECKIKSNESYEFCHSIECLDSQVPRLIELVNNDLTVYSVKGMDIVDVGCASIKSAVLEFGSDEIKVIEDDGLITSNDEEYTIINSSCKGLYKYVGDYLIQTRPVSKGQMIVVVSYKNAGKILHHIHTTCRNRNIKHLYIKNIKIAKKKATRGGLLVKIEITIYSDLMALDGIEMNLKNKNIQTINSVSKINGQEGIIELLVLVARNGIYNMEMGYRINGTEWRQEEEIFIQ